MAIPKEPRQLMINLMYLVLTALLALNVSAEIINAFFSIDKGIANSNSIIDGSNEFALAALNQNAEQDREKYQPLVDAAKQIIEVSEDFNDYIDEVRDSMVELSGGVYDDDARYPGRPKGYKNKDITTLMFVNQGKGDEIEERIRSDRDKILEIVNGLKGLEGTAINNESVANLEKSIALGISEDWKKSDAPNWGYYTFNQMPVASLFPVLRKFQNDMKSSEAAVLNFLVEQLGKTTFKVDAFIPIASAEKSYVIAGDTYNADITIGASSKSVYENMQVRVNGNSLEVNEEGIAEYSTRTSGTGVKRYNVSITLINPTTGEEETYEKEFEYEVGRRSVTVSADKMNVFYIGVDNPVSIAAAGVSTNQLRVSGSGGGIKMNRTGTGKYNVRVSQQGDATITVAGGGLASTQFDFRVKRIPDPVARLGNVDSGPIGNGTFKAQRGLVAWLDNFDFDAKCQIQGFELVYVAKRKDPVPAINSGGSFSGDARRLINKAKPGDTYYFDNVKARCPGDKAGRKINSLVFRIN